ncbi:malonate decarboxylase holo-[acyl-carrier-protein] synthase [Variovorax paradoxus]|nr:malonate decarboxylase holo-[acyl-carrier-protein] synthase [Variovorax paradoxus]
MDCPRRHQLARLSDAGWTAILRQPWDTQARECLTHWATHRLPLVVTRRVTDAVAEGWLAVGLSAPARWDRRRLALQVPHAAVLGYGEFPRLADVRGLLPEAAQAAVRDLVDALGTQGATARVFGSYGWQAISGLAHIRRGSDLDLWIGVKGAAQADAVAHLLQSFGAARPRLDGELVFADGAAVAWREWIEWRAGRARAVMVKRLEGVALQHDRAWCEPGECVE